MSEESGTGCALARIEPVGARARVRVGARVLTVEAVERFAEVLLSDLNHTVESAALEAGLRPSTVTDAISRYRNDKCRTLEDEAACELLLRIKHRHIMKLRAEGSTAAALSNRAGTAWAQWQLEVQDPLNHPRKQIEVEAMARATAKGDGEASAAAAVQIQVTVPPYESEG